LDSTVSGQGPEAGCCECGDEPPGSCATELVTYLRCENSGSQADEHEDGCLLESCAM
jgi:hypothetical protein